MGKTVKPLFPYSPDAPQWQVLRSEVAALSKADAAKLVHAEDVRKAFIVRVLTDSVHRTTNIEHSIDRKEVEYLLSTIEYHNLLVMILRPWRPGIGSRGPRVPRDLDPSVRSKMMSYQSAITESSFRVKTVQVHRTDVNFDKLFYQQFDSSTWKSRLATGWTLALRRLPTPAELDALAHLHLPPWLAREVAVAMYAESDGTVAWKMYIGNARSIRVSSTNEVTVMHYHPQFSEFFAEYIQDPSTADLQHYLESIVPEFRKFVARVRGHRHALSSEMIRHKIVFRGPEDDRLYVTTYSLEEVLRTPDPRR